MSTMTSQTRLLSSAVGIMAAVLLVLVTAACDHSSDPIAPADSTLTVSANPQTVIVPSSGCNQPTDCITTVVATLRSKSGTRLPDQEVTFSTSAGNLDPIADTSILTDDNGQASSILQTNQGATVTARSGSITGTTQIQTTPSPIGQVLLDVENLDAGGTRLRSCNDTLELLATVFDPSSDPVPGVIVQFNVTGTIGGSFDPQQTTTDPNGEALSEWTPSNQCSSKCMSDPNNTGICTFSFTATAVGVTSAPVRVDDEIP